MNLDQNTRSASMVAIARRWASSFGVVALLLNGIAGPASAGTYDDAMGRTNYVVMTGDVNGDGQNDVLMKAVPKIVLIPLDDDLSVPIPIPVPSPTFALISTTYGIYSLVVNPSAEILNSVKWAAATQQVAFAAASGSYAGSVTITAASSEQASFVVAMAADTGQLQLTGTTAPAVDTTSAALPAPIAVVIDVPHLNNADAGTLPGSLSVAPSGAAAYSIPLVVPLGSAGVQPSLSLNYSSSATNGLVGLGWSVGGLSSIHRCGKTIAQDKINGRIGFDSGDRLCLDGQRLVRVNGTAPGTDEAANDAAYWAASPVAEYRTEIDSFSRITVIAGPVVPGMTGPTLAFKVESKDGHIMTYGSTASSYVLPVMGLINSGLAEDGTPMPQPAAKTGARSWAIDSIEDRSGNYVNFSYDQNATTGEHRPTFIRYGGAGLSSHAAVQFVHAARQDAWKKYVDETRNDLRTRVEHILTYVGSNLDGDVVAAGTKVRDYALSYEYSPTSGRSLLNAVQVSARNPQTSIMETLPATTFSWGKPDPNKTPGFAHPASLGSSGLWQGAPILTTHKDIAVNGSYLSLNHADYFSFSDFENHGFTDVLEKRVASPSVAPTPLSADPTNSANPIRPGTLRNQYRYFHNNGNATGFTKYDYRISTGENFAVLDTGDFNGDGAPDLLVSTELNGPKICLSPLASITALVSTSTPITFDCTANRPVVGKNNVYGLPYVVDVKGDGRAGVYSKIDKDTLIAQLCTEWTTQWECKDDPSASTTVLGYTYTKFGTPPSAPDHDYVSYNQMVDFTGTGKPADLRWTRPYYLEYVYEDVNKLFLYEWKNRQPQVLVTGFQIPGTAAAKMQPYTYAAYSIVRPEDGGRAPYAFDTPASGAGLAADFNGSGYSGVAFGFKEFHIDATMPGGLAYTRKELTLCLSTGRAFDCGIRKKYSGASYANVLAVGNFVGDGQPTVLLEPATAGGKYQMCSIAGDDTTGGTGTTDNNLVCRPWDGTPALVTMPNDDPVWGEHGGTYFMDLLGTGRTQVVVYHPGRFVNNVWVEDGTWEVFEPVDVAVAGQALDRIYQVTNGVGATGAVEYADGIVGGIVSRSCASALTYPQYRQTSPGKLVKRLRLSNGGNRESAVNYKYQNAATDLAGRGSLGFGQVTSTDEQTGFVTTTTYAQVFPYTGMALSTVTTDGTCVLSDASSVAKQMAIPQANGVTTVFPFIARGSASRHDLKVNGCANLGTTVSGGAVGTDVQYDSWGNLLDSKVVTSNADSMAGATYTMQTVNTYFAPDTANMLVGLLKNSTVTKQQSSDGGSIARTVAYEYDTSGRVKTETAEPDDVAFTVKTSYTRGNAFGLVSAKTVSWRVPATDVAASWHDPAAGTTATRTEYTDYDAKGRFPSKVTNALAQFETYEYDQATGVRTSVTGPNLLKTQWIPNGFGRVITELRADGNETRQYQKQCNNDCPTDAVTVNVTEQFHGDARIAVPTITYADSAGHLLRTQSYGFAGSAVIIDQSYDTRGRLYEAFWPRFVGAAAVLAKRQQYDDVNRVTSTVTRDQGGTERTSSTKYAGIVTTITNSLQQIRVESRDALGRVTQVKDPLLGLTKFLYDSWGNLSSTTDPKNNIITVGYDKLGRKTQLVDPDLGTIEYAVDPIGQTWKQVSPNQRALGGGGQSTTFSYDLLGRMTARYETELESHWVFDQQPGGNCVASTSCGQLLEVYTVTGGVKDYSRLQTYDGMGRPSMTTQLLSDGVYTSKPTYDLWGRVARQKYQRGTDAAKVFDTRYNVNGYLARIDRGALSLWVATAQDAAGRLTKATLGNGLLESKDYNQYTGWLESASLKTAGQSLRVEEGYQYDALGSVSDRTQYWDTAGFTEHFTYDDLNRLRTSQVMLPQPQPLQTFTYDAVGSILTKTGTGTGLYSYPQGAGVARPHAVQSIVGIVGVFGYDLNGNQITAPGRSASWTSFDMPKCMTKGTSSSSFVYGPEHQRLRQVTAASCNGTATGTIIYAGAQEVETIAGQVTVKTYWPGGVGLEIDKPGLATELNWIHDDRLGSPIAISGSDGVLKEKLAYDAWGKRRSLDGSSTADSIDGATDNKGFTGHEMLDQLDLVHMNGRVYDPLIGKFLSGDPLVQDPINGQGYNRYSYVLNNPTNMTDPTGFACAATTGSRIPDCGGVGGASSVQIFGDNSRSKYDSGGINPRLVGPPAPAPPPTNNKGVASAIAQASANTTAGTNTTVGNNSGADHDVAYSGPSGLALRATNNDEKVGNARHSGEFTIGGQPFYFYGGTNEERIRAEAELRIVFGTERGKVMLSTVLAKNDWGVWQRPFGIDISASNNSIARIDSNMIHVDPNYHHNIDTTAGSIVMTTMRMFAHEFGHAIMNAPLEHLDIRKSMININANENPIMQELGQPARIRY